jgi:phosphoribosylformylglycinamidine synthase
MPTPRVLILRAPGTNCDAETAHAFELAGAAAERWHVNRLLESPVRLADFQILCVPGGFSYGDDLSAGRIMGSQLSHHLAGALDEFRAADKLVLGVCNGFQVLLKTHLLAPADERGPIATLALNESGHFEARWVRLAVEPGNCVFLHGIRELELPVAHAEGRFVVRDAAAFEQLEKAGQLVLRYQAPANCGSQMVYSNHHTKKAETGRTVPYPGNPNGAMGNVAGICDASGRVLGLMPHPERFVDRTQHPRWTRLPDTGAAGGGLAVFRNAVRYFR